MEEVVHTRVADLASACNLIKACNVIIERN